MAIALNSQKDNSPIWAVILLIILITLAATFTCSCKNKESKLSVHTYVISTSVWTDTVQAQELRINHYYRIINLYNNDTITTVYRLGINDSYHIYEIK